MDTDKAGIEQEFFKNRPKTLAVVVTRCAAMDLEGTPPLKWYGNGSETVGFLFPDLVTGVPGVMAETLGQKNGCDFRQRGCRVEQNGIENFTKTLPKTGKISARSAQPIAVQRTNKTPSGRR